MSRCAGSYQVYSYAGAYRVTASFRLRVAPALSCRQACKPLCQLSHNVSKKLVTPAGNKAPSIAHRTMVFMPSQTGRLIVVGDVHGCAVELAELLLKLQYVRGVDELIFVGDLVNKGPRSRQVLQIAMQAGGHAVRGNHEEFALARHNKNQPLKAGSSWVNDMSADEVSFMSQMPFTISIPSLDLLIVHAGMVPNIQKEHQQWTNLCTMRAVYKITPGPVSDPSKIRYEDIRFYGSGVRPPYMLNWASLWRGPQHILFGHDAQQGLQKYAHATGIDTGCVYGGSLTACVIPIPQGIEAVSRLQGKTTPTLEDLGAKLVSVPARRAYKKV